MSRIWYMVVAGISFLAVAVFLIIYGRGNSGTIDPGDWIQVVALSLLAFLTSLYALATFRQADATAKLASSAERTLLRANRTSLDVAAMEHNWKLYENKVDPGLPGLPPHLGHEEYWKWRMVHLDHLNLLSSQFLAFNSAAASDLERTGWCNWAKLLVGELQNDYSMACRSLGVHDALARQLMDQDGTPVRLNALLHISERHNWDLLPHAFVDWLFKECGFESLRLTPKR